jgi:hypothetical protein
MTANFRLTAGFALLAENEDLPIFLTDCKAEMRLCQGRYRVYSEKSGVRHSNFEI